MTETKTPHCATFTDSIVELLTTLLADAPGPILDPFAGVGGIHGCGRDDTVGIELEACWADQHERTQVGNALDMPFEPHTFGTICTSPTYGNRMADTYDGRDGSSRQTYTISKGAPLEADNSGGMAWGTEYREFHRRVWSECVRVLQPGGLMIVNMKDHNADGQRQYVTEWHLTTLLQKGFRFETAHTVETPGQRFGANSDQILPYESVLVMRAPVDLVLPW